jgi:hypothetical protein
MAKHLKNQARGERAKILAVAAEVRESAKRNEVKRGARVRIEAKARLEAAKARRVSTPEDRP